MEDEAEDNFDNEAEGSNDLSENEDEAEGSNDSEGDLGSLLQMEFFGKEQSAEDVCRTL